jgi:predicted nucleotidyltransferase
MAAAPRVALDRLRDLAVSGELDAFCADHGVDLLVVFGSTVDREPVRPPRDLDIAVLFAGHGGGDLIQLITDLIGLLNLPQVDVMDLGQAGVVARAKALGLCEPLYEREPGLFAREQMAALPQLLDTAWIKQLSLELLAA